MSKFFSVLFFFASLSFLGECVVVTPAIASDFKKDCSTYLTGDIPNEFVNEVAQKNKLIPETTKQLRRIAQKEGFGVATYNQDLLRQHDNHYTVEVPMGPITDQKQSGRCWIFASLNMVRSDLIGQKKVGADFSFSQNYLHFFNMLEKSNHVLEDLIRYSNRNPEVKNLKPIKKKLLTRISDGGTFAWFLFLVSKYGLVPKKAMPETVSSEATATLNRELVYQLNKISDDLLAEIAAMQKDMPPDQKLSSEQLTLLRQHKLLALHEIAQILTTHLGEPPQHFNFKYSNFTPESFATEFVRFNPKDYVFISNNPHRELNQVYEVKNSTIGIRTPGKPSYPYRTLNVDMDRFQDLITKSLDHGQPLYFSADSTKDIDRQTGIMHPNLINRNLVYGFSSGPLDLSRKEQMALHTTSPNHAMAITGYERVKENEKVIKYKVENSWGSLKQSGRETGDKGIFHMYRPWLEKYVFQYAIHRKFLSTEEQKLWDEKAQLINPSEGYYE